MGCLLRKQAQVPVPGHWKRRQGYGKQGVKGTNTFKVIRYEDTPLDKQRDNCHSHAVCKIRPEKDNPNRIRITVVGGNIFYPGEVATLTGSLGLTTLTINSVMSQPGARFACFNIKNFYLDTPDGTKVWVLGASP